MGEPGQHSRERPYLKTNSREKGGRQQREAQAILGGRPVLPGIVTVFPSGICCLGNSCFQVEKRWWVHGE